MKRLIPFLLLLTACSGDPVDELKGSDSITFGQFFGFCQGEQCIEIYKLTSSGLYEDITDKYPGRDEPYSGDFRKMADEKFQLAKGFESNIPGELLSQKERVIGMPDAGDWGGYYFEVSINGERNFWIIDKNQLYLPENLKPFASELGDLIAQLSN